MTESLVAAAPRSARYVFLDAWRGIAALGVLFHHMLHNSVMERTLRKVLPEFVLVLDRVAAYRIPIFMILSGFVIAHALRKNPLTSNSIGNFVLRRHLRLDPVYWIMIVIVLLLQGAESLMPSLASDPMPGSKTVLLNFLYLQNITNIKPIVDVAWTLCIELQFYLVYVVLLVLSKRISGNDKESPYFERNTMLLVFGLGCFSLVWIHFVTQKAWFTHYWQYFALGTLCWAAVHRPHLRALFFCFLGALAVSALFSPLSPLAPDLPQLHGERIDGNTSAPAMAVGFLLSVLIYWVGVQGKLTTMWNNKPIQYIGRISYSLYLVHLSVVLIVLRIGYKITGTNGTFAIFWFILSALLSIAVAHLFYVLFERPTMAYAARFKPKSEARIPLPQAPDETANAAAPLPAG